MNYQGPGIYRHYKGGEYEVLGLALQEDSIDKDRSALEVPDPVTGGITFVIYRPLTPGSLLEKRQEEFWARELSDFNAVLGDKDEGTRYPRFEFLRNISAASAATDLAAAALRASAALTVNELGPAMEELKTALEKHKQFLPKEEGIGLDEMALNLSQELPFTYQRVRSALRQAEQAGLSLHKASDFIREGQRATGNGLQVLMDALPMLAQEEYSLDRVDQGKDLHTPPDTPVGPEEED